MDTIAELTFEKTLGRPERNSNLHLVVDLYTKNQLCICQHVKRKSGKLICRHERQTERQTDRVQSYSPRRLCCLGTTTNNQQVLIGWSVWIGLSGIELLFKLIVNLSMQCEHVVKHEPRTGFDGKPESLTFLKSRF